MTKKDIILSAKSKILLLVLFIFINTSIYLISENIQKHRINLILKENLNKLQIHYDILYLEDVMKHYMMSKPMEEIE